VILFLNQKFKEFYRRLLCIHQDEKMIKYTGRSKFKQYIANKPTKWGFKAFILACSTTAYVYAWKLYEGKEEKPVKNLAFIIVSELLEGLSNKGHKLYMDSYYMSVQNAIDLSKRMIGLTGTIKQNSRNLPKEMSGKSELKKGDFLAFRSGNLSALRWKDRKEVRMISNVHGYNDDGGKPEMVKIYTKCMGGVDRGDQFSAFYMNDHKSVRWWLRIFISLLDSAILNAFILYKAKVNSNITQLEFKEMLIKEVFDNYTKLKNQKNPMPTTNQSAIYSNMHKISTRKKKLCCL